MSTALVEVMAREWAWCIAHIDEIEDLPEAEDWATLPLTLGKAQRFTADFLDADDGDDWERDGTDPDPAAVLARTEEIMKLPTQPLRSIHL